MLRELRVRNFAVVENVTVPFGPGLNVLTGETGAGKSVLIDAILLVRGGRAQADVIRTDTDHAVVEALFEVKPGSPAGGVLEDAGLGTDEGMLVIRRELSRQGRHRAFANDSPVTVGLLERLGDCLVEIHGQHEHQRLLERGHQLDLLDRFAGAEDLRQRVAELYRRHAGAREEVARLQAADRERAQREDLLRFQAAELSGARLEPGEEDALRTERARLLYAERLRAGLAEVRAALRDDADAAAPRVARAARILGDLGRLDDAFRGPGEALASVAAQIEEVLLQLRALGSGLDGEPGRLEAIDDRLDALSRLKRKYGDTIEAMLEHRARATAELQLLERGEEMLADATRRAGEAAAELHAAAGELGRARAAAAARLAPLVQREVRGLGMERARVEIRVDGPGAGEVGPRGRDVVEFLLAANPGEDPRPLGRIASGGELSRAMLALHAVLAAANPVPTMVFDEVDAGIGGRVAGAVADRLAAVAAARQVLCVTHLPQIAARAQHHLRVDKAIRGGRTRATVSAVAGGERVDEVARMLGGEPLTETARRHARELLKAAGRSV